MLVRLILELSEKMVSLYNKTNKKKGKKYPHLFLCPVICSLCSTICRCLHNKNKRKQKRNPQWGQSNKIGFSQSFPSK